MANSKGSQSIRNMMYSGKHPLLPPKIPFPSVYPSNFDYVPSNIPGSKAVQRPMEGHTHHQRTSSETFLIEDQPSWLEDLLNEPETPVRRGGHRRSSSDSFAHIDVANASNLDYAAQDDYRYKHMMSIPSWGSQEYDYRRDARQASVYADVNTIKQKNRTWDSSLNHLARQSALPPTKDSAASLSSGSTCALQEADVVSSSASEKLDSIVSGPHDSKALSERKDSSHTKSSASETETKRAKQQFAQRSRVRKLQYIADLERNVQALQAEGSEVSAEVEFLNQQNLILSMENKALKQRLESLAQEQLIKCLEHEVLEREIGRLKALYQQQQQPQQQQQRSSSSHRRTKSRELESQFGSLTLKHTETSSDRDPVTGSLRT